MAFDDLDQAEQAEDEHPEKPPGGDEPQGQETSNAEDSEATAEPSRTDRQSGSRSNVDTGESSKNASNVAPDSAATATGEPSFGFEEAKQRPLYARQGAWDAFEDALAIEVEPTLRRHDVRDASKRELHDAALRVLADHADEVADRVLEGRGVRDDQTR